jgi:hypothetical protein
MKDSMYWVKLSPDGPRREFQLKLEKESGNMSMIAFAHTWSKRTGYSVSSVSHWMAGTRTIPQKALESVGISTDELGCTCDSCKNATTMKSDSNTLRQLKVRQKAIDRMCGSCSLGDRFCRIRDCALREFSPLPLHPRAVMYGSWEDDGNPVE